MLAADKALIDDLSDAYWEFMYKLEAIFYYSFNIFQGQFYRQVALKTG